MKQIVRFLLLTTASLALAVLPSVGTAAIGVSLPPRLVPAGHNPATTSTNWAGYAVPASAGAVSRVRGYWVVPAVTCSSGDQYSAVWIGIDGYNSSSVEQTGTEQDCAGATARYSAWYEMYPALPTTLGMTIHPGDRMAADVLARGSGTFTLQIENLTSGAKFSVNKVNKSAALSSAEWIVEAPSNLLHVLPLADFGTSYSVNSAATISGTTGVISSFAGAVPITMINGSNVVKAQPSGLAGNGGTFKVVWQHK